ncbi:MAG: amidase, partial [Euzebyales bacterium]|nr:amidase [Euzebyales bacterium]
MPPDLTWRPAVELARMLRRREVSPVELLQACLARIDAVDGSLNSLVTLDPETAMATARDAERRLVDGEDRPPPFLGVPLAVKDLHLTAGLRTTFGCRALEAFVPDADEEHVARLRAAGFVVLAKTNVPEFGTLPYTESALLG